MKKLVQNAMKQRFTWEDSAKKYEEVYTKAVNLRKKAV